MSRGSRPSTAFIGSGRLARALLPPLVAAGWPVVALAARRRPAGLKARGAHRDVRVTTVPATAACLAQVVLLAVPDGSIAPLARELAAGRRTNWQGKAVLHHAGSLGLEPLRPLAEAGAAVGVLHPLQVLGDPATAARLLRGSRARIEGDRRGLSLARRMARDLGLVPLAHPASITAAQRTAYHAAAALVSNDLVALLSLGVELLEEIGIERGQALAALVPLARGTLEQVAREGLAGSLTGPVVRGDCGTLQAHLEHLSRRGADEAELHRLLSRRLLRLLEREGRAPSPALRRRLRRLLGPGPSGPSGRGTV